MYLGPERKKGQKPIREMDYDSEDQAHIADLVTQIRNDYPEFTDRQARIWEILSRYRGDAGLSASAVSYLASAIEDAIS